MQGEPHLESSFFSIDLSQFEMSGWELLPGAVLMLFLCGGCVQILKNRKNQRLIKEKRKGSPRKRLSVPMIIDTPITQSFSVKSYDISTSGAFIPLFEMKESMNFSSLIGKRSGIKVGDIVGLKLQTGRFSYIHCQGRVVRFNLTQTDSHPEVIGIKFLDMSRRDQKKLESLLADNKFSEVI